MKNSLFQTNLDSPVIAKLIQELEESGCHWHFGCGSNADEVSLHIAGWDRGGKVSRETGADSFFSNSMLGAFEAAADFVRGKQGKPSLAEEAAAMAAQEGQVVYFEPGAKCLCGSEAGLIVSRKVFLFVPWDGSFATTSPEGAKGFEVRQLPGEFGTCADCGKSYRFAL